MNCRTNCSKTFVLVLTVLALAIVATPAFGAGTCLQDEYNNVAKQKLNCIFLVIDAAHHWSYFRCARFWLVRPAIHEKE